MVQPTQHLQFLQHIGTSLGRVTRRRQVDLFHPSQRVVLHFLDEEHAAERAFAQLTEDDVVVGRRGGGREGWEAVREEERNEK
jgi:hypothetical protein